MQNIRVIILIVQISAYSAKKYASEKLNAQPGFFASLVHTVVELLGQAFPEVSRSPQSIIDIINEEEQQFLKTLSKGRNLFYRTINKLNDSNIIPGDVAWRLYDTYGFPIDLTQLMAEEKNLKINMKEYEIYKQNSYIISQGKEAKKIDDINLDVHAINILKEKCIVPTDDSYKYEYNAISTERDADYKFETCFGKILAIFFNKKFVSEVHSGQKCGLILDKTNFYAESGGQIYDQGVLIKTSDDAHEFFVDRVYNQGGYLLHIGVVEGILSLGDELNLQIDVSRRLLIMRNHSATHALNYSLSQVLGAGTSQKGSLVVPEKLRFDFSCKSAMTINQLAKCEQLTRELIFKNVPIYARESSLSIAQRIHCVRSVFGEMYPDPVRVISFGVPVELLENNSDCREAEKTSVEFCGGTHLKRSGHIIEFAISSEESISKGVRRIVALTGPEAIKAIRKSKEFENEIEELRVNIKNNAVGKNSKNYPKMVVDLTQRILQANIPYVKKDEFRNLLQQHKKLLDDNERHIKAFVTAQVVEKAREFCEQNSTALVLVKKLDANKNTKALDSALKQVRQLCPDTAAMFFSIDTDLRKVFCLCNVPKIAVQKGLKANDWVHYISVKLGGKGGGTEESAQCSGSNYENIDEILEIALSFAKSRLNAS